MKDGDKAALQRLMGAGAPARATTDDLQGLLLQVSLALLMIFMIAYFIFVEAQKKERAEEVLALNRQKLVLALDKVAEDRRIRYGLNALMTQGVDGKRTFEPDGFVRGGKLSFAPAAREAFAAGGRAALADYADRDALAKAWRDDVLAAAGLKGEDLAADEADWLEKSVAEGAEAVRLDARGVQRALAARLQRQWIAHPEALGRKAADADPSTLAALLKSRSLKLVSKEIGAEVLP